MKGADLTPVQNAIYTEKYRPSSFDELIGDHKDIIQKYLDKPMEMPSFIFYSNSPGTGKTSMAKVIVKALKCDSEVINSSDERGIDVIREKVSLFARSMSSNDKTKKCVFMDEADGMLKAAQDSLRNLMETYASNCFFIFSSALKPFTILKPVSVSSTTESSLPRLCWPAREDERRVLPAFPISQPLTGRRAMAKRVSL